VIGGLVIGGQRDGLELEEALQALHVALVGHPGVLVVEMTSMVSPPLASTHLPAMKWSVRSKNMVSAPVWAAADGRWAGTDFAIVNAYVDKSTARMLASVDAAGRRTQAELQHLPGHQTPVGDQVQQGP
jgi:hypothetical protein